MDDLTKAGRERQRLALACLQCRGKKIKCSGTQPCSNCAKSSCSCTYRSAPRRRVPHSLPDTEAIPYLVELYFTYIYGHVYAFFHRPSFTSALKHNALPPALVYSVCAVSARYSSNPSNTPRWLAGEQFANEARRLVLAEYDQPSIYNVQSLVNLALHDFGANMGRRAWMFAGIAFRMATLLRLNEELDGYPLGSAKHPWLERETRRRTFWACFTLDRLNSNGIYRPCAIDEDDCLVQLPAPEHNFVFDVPVHTQTLSSTPPETLPAAFISAVSLWGKVTKYINTKSQTPPWEPTSQFSLLESELNAWTNCLPKELALSKDSIAAHANSGLLPNLLIAHALNLIAKLVLNRFCIPTNHQLDPPIDYLRRRAEACFAIAYDATVLLASTVDPSADIPTSTVPVLGFISYSACLFHTQRFTKCENQHMANQLFASGLSFLEKVKDFWGPLQLLYENLVKVQTTNVAGYSLPTTIDDSARLSISCICDQSDLLAYLSNSPRAQGDLLRFMETSHQHHSHWEP